MTAQTAPGAAACGLCAYRENDRALLEVRIGGLASLGSAYGASVGDSRLCVRHDRLVSPSDRCSGFVARGVTARSTDTDAAPARTDAGTSR
jgi:hypothetical protein